jgi:hypothetical protein
MPHSPDAMAPGKDTEWCTLFHLKKDLSYQDNHWPSFYMYFSMCTTPLFTYLPGQSMASFYMCTMGIVYIMYQANQWTLFICLPGQSLTLFLHEYWADLNVWPLLYEYQDNYWIFEYRNQIFYQRFFVDSC